MKDGEVAEQLTLTPREAEALRRVLDEAIKRMKNDMMNLQVIATAPGGGGVLPPKEAHRKCRVVGIQLDLVDAVRRRLGPVPR